MLVGDAVDLFSAAFSIRSKCCRQPGRRSVCSTRSSTFISGFRYFFFGVGDVSIWVSLAALAGFIVTCLILITWIVRTGYKLKT